MQRYFFDIEIGDDQARDGDGSMLADDDAARDEAMDLLMAVARERLNEGDRRELLTRVRDETGDVLLIAKLLLITEWVADPIRPG